MKPGIRIVGRTVELTGPVRYRVRNLTGRLGAFVARLTGRTQEPKPTRIRKPEGPISHTTTAALQGTEELKALLQEAVNLGYRAGRRHRAPDLTVHLFNGTVKIHQNAGIFIPMQEDR